METGIQTEIIYAVGSGLVAAIGIMWTHLMGTIKANQLDSKEYRKEMKEEMKELRNELHDCYNVLRKEKPNV